MPYLSTGHRGKLPARFHSASGVWLRPFSKISAPLKKMTLTLIWGLAKKPKRICRTMTAASQGGMEYRKGTGIALVRLGRLIFAKASEMLPRIQAE